MDDDAAIAAYLKDDRIVAASPITHAPEYYLRAVLRREFDRDSPAVRLVIQGPFEAETEYWDSHHVRLVLELLRRALPSLQQAETALESDWHAWHGREPEVG